MARSTHRSGIRTTGDAVAGIPVVEMPPLPAQNPPKSFVSPPGGLATIDTKMSGPFFSGLTQIEVEAFLHFAVHEVASQALADWHQNLNQSLQHPTPYYETQIMVQPMSTLQEVVHDRGIIYGPWLEGVSRRNQATRFKGYASLRRAFQSVQGKVNALAGAALARFVGKM